MLGRLHALVVGCGLGRHQPVLEAAKQLCARAAAEGAAALQRIEATVV